MMAPPFSFLICGSQATTTHGSGSLTTARIGCVTDEAADCRARRSTDADTKPCACQSSACNTTYSAANGRARNRPFCSRAGGSAAREGDDSPNHKKFTHHSNSTDGSPAIRTVSMQFVKI
jgi:hypothetical protein